MYHVSGILIPIHQKLVCLGHCPRVPVLTLCVCVIYLLEHITKCVLV